MANGWAWGDMNTQGSDVRALIERVSGFSGKAYCFAKPRRLTMWNLTGITPPTDIELPSWLSLLWLLDGQHWKKSSMHAMSVDDVLAELYSVLKLIEE